MVKAVKGTLVKCDASIKAILLNIDATYGGAFIIEDLDEEYVLVKDTKIAELKQLLQSKMKEIIKEIEESGSDDNK